VVQVKVGQQREEGRRKEKGEVSSARLGSGTAAAAHRCRNEQRLTVVSESRVENGGKHERLVEELVDALLVGLDADNAVLSERAGTCRQGGSAAVDTKAKECYVPSARRRMDWRRFLMRTGLKTLSWRERGQPQ